LGLKCNFKESIWSKQVLNCINIKVWWAIKDLMEKIQNQGPKWKRCVNVKFEIDQLRAQIEDN
jgi:hypothetical protein